MKAILFDTSVWVNFFKGIENDNSLLLRYYLENNHSVLLCPPIYQEILQGCKKIPEYIRMILMLESLEKLTLEDHYEAAREASRIYIVLRNAGYTIRKPNDCLIAYYSIYYKISLIHNNSDFEIISKKYKLVYD